MNNSEQPLKILVVDDEDSMRFFLKEALARENYDVDTASNGAEAIEKIEAADFKTVILDIRMAKMNGMEVLEKVHKTKPELPIILMTAYGSKKVAMEAVEKGAYDYFTKPFDLNEMRIVVKRAVEKMKLENEIRSLRSQPSKQYEFEGIVGASREMQEVFDLVSKVVNNDVNVIIYGESGTGKELIASLIHERGPWKNKPMVKLNCAAIPETLLESEMFGHEKGAFTGASIRKTGKLEQANDGTLFLDEIGDMSSATQAKLLRVLEKHEFERLGGTELIKVNIRLISATNKDLPRMVQEKKFREDLYFRLNVVPVFLPPLRNRKSDIPLMVEHFLKTSSERFNKEINSVSRETMRILMDYDWPGNVRELENVVQRAVITAKGATLDTDSLPATIKGGKAAKDDIPLATEHLDRSLSEVVESITEAAEKQLIIEALDKTQWSRTKTSELLGICRKSLHNKMKKYGIAKP